MASERKVVSRASSAPVITPGVGGPRAHSSQPPSARNRTPGRERLSDPAPAQRLSIAPENQRRFDLIDPNAPAPEPPSRAHILWFPVLAVALVVVAFVRSLLVRTLLPLALAFALVAWLVRRDRKKKRLLRERARRRGLFLQSAELRFKPGAGEPSSTVLDLTKPFGATLLATHRRERLVLVLTSERGVFHVGTVVETDALQVLAPILDRATTVAGEDSAFEAIGPDGDPVLLTPPDFVLLAKELATDAPGCLSRVIVTDTKGAPIVLDNGELRVDDLAFDLNSPLEWRALVFQEPFGQVMTLYQGTWIRQNGSEVVLVSLLPSLGPILEVEPGEIATMDRAVLRDLRLMQATAETPPPREQRHAIERLLMMPIRSSLDRAPRLSRQTAAPRRTPLH